MSRLRERRAAATASAGRRQCRLHRLRAPADERGAGARCARDRRRDPRRHSRGERVRRGDDARPAQHQRLDVPQQPAAGAFNMVYRRDDGTIGWVEPTAQVTSGARRVTAARLSCAVAPVRKCMLMILSRIPRFRSDPPSALAAGNKRQLLNQLAQIAGAAAVARPAGDRRFDRRARAARLDRLRRRGGHPARQARRARARLCAGRAARRRRSITRRSTAARSTWCSCCCRRPTPGPSI